MAERVLLHVGIPKCGTTFLQTVLWSNRDRLASNGVLVPGRRLFGFNLAALAVRAEGGSVAANVWQRMTSRAREWPGTVVISNEWFVLASAEQARLAVQALGPAEVDVVVTARPFTALVPAAWQEMLKLGRGHSFSDFMVGLDRDGERWSWSALDPAAVLSRWAGDLSPARGHVIAVPPRGTPPDVLWRRFAAVCGLDADAYDIGEAHANESLGAESARFLQRFGPALRAAVDADTSDWRDSYRWLRRYLGHELLVPYGGRRIALRPEHHAALAERSASVVGALVEGGYQVVGDPDDLSPEPRAEGAVLPEDVSAEDQLQVAARLTAALLRRVRDETLRAERVEEHAAAAERHRPDLQPDRRVAPAAQAVSAWGSRTVRGGIPVVARRAREVIRRSARSGIDVSARRIYLLMFRVEGVGGVARTVVTLANELVKRHEVEIVALYRRKDTPAYTVDPRVTISYLEDLRQPAEPGRRRNWARARDAPQRGRWRWWLDRRPSRCYPAELEEEIGFSALTDWLLWRKLRSLRPGVLISTRPSLHAAAARWAPRHVLSIAQEHSNYELRDADLERGPILRRTVAEMDGYVVLTEADRRDFSAKLAGADTMVAAIPNASPWPVAQQPSALDGRIVVSGGRLAAEKGFSRLIEAFRPIQGRHPDWRLHIYGAGPEGAALRRLIRDLGLGATVELKGYNKDFGTVLSGASVFAMTSLSEGFPMVLVEAMSCGLPLVSFDCPRGPAEIIVNERNGLLVPDGDIDAFTQALLRAIEDDEARARWGANARSDAGRYQVGAVASQWESLFDELTKRRSLR